MTEAIEPPSVVVEGLHVRYRVMADSRRSMREVLARGLRTRTSIEVHALKGVDFKFRKGEIIGIVGSNGPGKSTCKRGVDRTSQRRRPASASSIRCPTHLRIWNFLWRESAAFRK